MHPSSSTFTASAELPDVLRFVNGSRVASPSQWEARRTQLKALLMDHILGTLPMALPELTSAKILNSSTSASLCGSYVRLAFLANPNSTVEFDIELAWRCSLASAKLPIFLTQYNHRGWALVGAHRGYLSLLYPGGDTRDASDDFRAAYPEATMRKILARAFVASRAIDFLTSSQYSSMTDLPPINSSRISISGHSRNGKQALVAAAFDERIASVVGSSPGTPITAPVRFSSPDFNGVSPPADFWVAPSVLALSLYRPCTPVLTPTVGGRTPRRSPSCTTRSHAIGFWRAFLTTTAQRMPSPPTGILCSPSSRLGMRSWPPLTATHLATSRLLWSAA